MPKTYTTHQLPLPSLIRASAWDAGNESMRAGGRSVWSQEDVWAAGEFQNRVRIACFGEGPMGCLKFSYAEAMEKAGALRLGMKAKDFFATLDASWEAYLASMNAQAA